jgi:hypothetical protein
MAWVRARRAGKQLAHASEAPEPLSWPDLPEEARYAKSTICNRHAAGQPYLSWKRPASSALDPSRPLLATGRYADEEEAAQQAALDEIASLRMAPARKPPGWGRDDLNPLDLQIRAAWELQELRWRQPQEAKRRQTQPDGDGTDAAAPPAKRRSPRLAALASPAKA